MGCAGSRENFSRSCAGFSVNVPEERRYKPDMDGSKIDPSHAALLSPGAPPGPMAHKRSLSKEWNKLGSTPRKNPKKSAPKTKSLTDMSLVEATKISELLREKMMEEVARVDHGGKIKVVDLKLHTTISEEAHPLVTTSLKVDHLSHEDQSTRFESAEAPDGTQCSISLDLPVKPKQMIKVGTLVGKILLIANQDQVKQQIPGYIELKRSTFKDDDGHQFLRLTAFFENTLPGMHNLELLKEFFVQLSLGSSSDSPPEQEAMNAEEAEEALESLDAAPSIFANLPEMNELGATFDLSFVIDRFVVSTLHSALSKGGYIASTAPEDDDAKPSSVITFLTLLSTLNHVDTRLRFEDVDELFENSPSLKELSQFLSTISRVPGDRVAEGIVSLFGATPADGRDDLETLYSKILKGCSAFLAYDGLYKVNVLSGGVDVTFTIKGIHPFPAFPTIERINAKLKQREEQAMQQALDAQRLEGIDQFDDAEFEKFQEEALAIADHPWKLTYPETAEDGSGEFVKVWLNEEQKDGRPRVKVQGYVPKVTADQAFNHFFDPVIRQRWDHFVGHCQTIEKFPTQEADVFLSVFATPPGVQNREFLEYRQVKRVDGGIIVLGRSCTHPRVPLNENRIRGTTIYSGYFFKTVTSADAGTATFVTGIVKQDLGGYLPSFMISQLNKRVIAEWMKLFIGSCIKSNSKRKSSQKYLVDNL